jgi:hypothetical protein
MISEDMDKVRGLDGCETASPSWLDMVAPVYLDEEPGCLSKVR